jgi:large subunit ribosomal protein L18
MKRMDSKRLRRKMSVRKKVSGTAERPRLTVKKSLKQIYAQMIDDNAGKTLVSASSLSKEIAAEIEKAANKTEISKIVGKHLGQKALDAKINLAVFDRNGYQYHGRVKALAEGAREGGLKI